MTPEAFSQRVAETIEGLGGEYQPVAQGDFGEGKYQSQVHFGTNAEGKPEYVLSVADTHPERDAFNHQCFNPLKVHLGAISFNDVELPPFEGLGNVTVPYSE